MFTGDIYIRGKYATYLKYLSQKTEKTGACRNFLQ